MLRWLENNRWKEILKEPFPTEWRKILKERVTHYSYLSPDEKTHREQLVHVFIAEKKFEGCNGTAKHIAECPGGALADGDAGLFRPFVDNLLGSDPFLVLADFQAYVDCQEQVGARWRDSEAWTRHSILTVARMDPFSSDRAIREYAEKNWQVRPLSGKRFFNLD